MAAMSRTVVSFRTQVRNLNHTTRFLHSVEMTSGWWSRWVMKSDIGRFLHAGRELDVEMLDGQFAGDEAGEELISHLNQFPIHS